MRVTMRTINANILGNLNRITDSLDQINKRISSGKEISRPSDNPVGLASALSLRSSLSQLTQYQENISYGRNFANGSENALTKIKEQVMRAHTLALQYINPSMSAGNRSLGAEEIRGLYDQTLALANTRIEGKYIFGGYRTTGYNDVEPTPFVKDQLDGHRINGADFSPAATNLTGTVANAAIAAGDLAINGTVTGVINTAAAVNGLNMTKAFNARAAITAADPTVSVKLTTLTSGGASGADTADLVDSNILFYLNGTAVNVNIADGSSAAVVVGATISAINARTGDTGVIALAGDGTNGGAAGTIVLQNSNPGDESSISISGYTVVAGDAVTGLGNFTQAVDAGHNTGQISISSAAAFTLSSPNNPSDDAVLASLGLGGGGVGFADDAADGILTFGSAITAGSLLVNRYDVGATVSDGVSDVLADVSAGAKAALINNAYDTTGVAAVVTPAWHTASQAVNSGSEKGFLTGILNGTAIAAGDLAINGIALGPINTAAAANGLYMQTAANARAAIDQTAAQTGVYGHLTTLISGGAAAAGTITNVSFSLNGVAVAFTTSSDPAGDVINAINAVSAQTGVEAVIGNGTNGGAAGTVVLRNQVSGDESNIVISGYNGGAGTATTGLGNISQGADATHNTGGISFSSNAAIKISSPNNSNDDSILNALGLGGGKNLTGVDNDQPFDGMIDYGSTPRFLAGGDLVINGIDIFTVPTLVMEGDRNNAMVNAINAKTAQTGVTAGRDSLGKLILTAVDGRNLHVRTSARGEDVSHLNGASPSAAGDKVYFGSVSLSGGLEFTLESPPTVDGYEAGLIAMGMSGGSAVTGEAADVAGDGVVQVTSIIKETGQVRYNGDRKNDFSVRIGSRSTLEVSKNGKAAILDTGVFSGLKKFEDALRGENFREVKGSLQVADTAATLASLNTGFDSDNYFKDGTFRVTVSDNSYSPARDMSVAIGVDIDNDTFADVAARINGIPGLSASWDADGYLTVKTDDQSRYSVKLSDESGNFLERVGVNFDQMQVQAISQALGGLETMQDTLTTQVSDFGARSNRIDVQATIFSDLKVTLKENLSEKQDTDITRAIMDLQAKQLAYQAALKSAAQTMQMSLVNFL